jgi:hypothetical protein
MERMEKKDMNFLRRITENEMMDHTCNEDLRININITINKRGKVRIMSTEANLCNHCCSGEAINITHSECVFVALVIQHNDICGLPGSTIFFTISPTGMIFRKCY